MCVGGGGGGGRGREREVDRERSRRTNLSYAGIRFERKSAFSHI